MQQKARWALIAGLTCTLSSSFAGGFVTEIDWAAPRVRFEELKETVRTHALRKGTGLSLGESHLEQLTTGRVFDTLIDAYLSSRPKNLKTCIEKSTGILESASYARVRAASTKVEIEQHNNPSRTDFTACEEKRARHYLVYSGFFHQYPFARAFPEVFAQTPVVKEPGNTIHAQMKNTDLLFATQMELPYLALQESQRLLRLAAKGDPSALDSALTETASAMEKLKNAMEVIAGDEIPERTKTAVILDRKSFPGFPAVTPHEKAFLLVTDLLYRQDRSPLYFLDEVTKLEPSTRNAFVSALQKDKHHLGSGLTERTSSESTAKFRVHGIDEDFGGETTFLYLYGGKVRKTLIVDPEVMKLRCFIEGKNEIFSEGSCSSVLGVF